MEWDLEDWEEDGDRDDLELGEIREALEDGSISVTDLEDRGIDSDMLFDLGLGAFIMGALLGGERRRPRRRRKEGEGFE